MDKNYNKDEKSKYIQYYDANNLYAWAMTQNFAFNGKECRVLLAVL